MPIEDLVVVRPVRVEVPEYDLPGFPRREVACETCGERVLDGRDVVHAGRLSCRSCAGNRYYQPLGDGPSGPESPV
jgi:formylmethanofuran dehydrogenase subunit E